jgi:methyl-accepting chemotaxis protein
MEELERKNQIRNLEDVVEEQQKQLQTLAEAVRELAKEVHANRDFIARQGEISNKIIEAVEIINDEVY